MLKKILAVLVMLYATLSFAAVDVNKATAAELDAIKGIGPAISGRIIEERKNGNFKDWSDFVSRVKGVGDVTASKFSAEGLTVNGASKTGAPIVKADKPAAAVAAKPAQAAAPAPAATDVKTDPKVDAKAKKEADKKAAAEEKAKKAEEAKAKKEADKKAKDDAKKAKADAKAAKPAASAASAPKK